MFSTHCAWHKSRFTWYLQPAEWVCFPICFSFTLSCFTSNNKKVMTKIFTFSCSLILIASNYIFAPFGTLFNQSMKTNLYLILISFSKSRFESYIFFKEMYQQNNLRTWVLSKHFAVICIQVCALLCEVAVLAATKTHGRRTQSSCSIFHMDIVYAGKA